MKHESNLRRVQQRVHGGDGQPQELPAAPDGDQLAREVVRAYADELKRYHFLKESEPNRFNPADPPCEVQIQGIRKVSPENVTFECISTLSKVDPAQGQARWEQVKEAARRDLDTGWLAGRALEYLGGSAWERACFLAIRDRLRRSWQPRNDCEVMLIDEMAQYQMVRLQWVGVLAMRSRDPETILRRKLLCEPSKEERRLSSSEQTAEAARMVELMQRLYQNAVRTLLGMRRGKSPTIFQRSAQVNVTVGPQLNINAQSPLDGNERIVPCEGDEHGPAKS